MPVSFIMSKNVEHSSEKTPREVIGRFIKFRYFSFLRTALLLRLDSKPTVNSRTYRHVDWIKKKKIWTIISTSYYWGIQKTINIGIEWRVKINYGLKWLGNEFKDWVVSPSKAIKVLLIFPLNLSLTQHENTHNHWVRLASSQVLGLFSEKTKGYMAYHRKVIYNPSNIQLQRTKSQANWNGVLEQQLGEKPPRTFTCT